ncbi:MAG: hypothetical protein PWQ88_174 [Candidatus Methanomethylophilaceae archaeon]|nr:hypothetical protein [Candidatus Methanomethylophilaceae archaeon]MDI3541687.1 hypothetical protein [Candidatus Methanomethylophilaceae archaeon]
MAGKKRRRKLDLSSDRDDAIVRLFLISLLVFAVVSVICILLGLVKDAITAIPIFSFSLVIVGFVAFADRLRWYYSLILIAVVAALYFYGVETIFILFILYAVLGGFGVVRVIVALQRKFFYRALSRIEGISLREELDFKDKLMIFLFNIPEGLNTSDLLADHNMKREHIPLDDILRTMGLGVIVGMFLWVYLSLNPAMLSIYSLDYILLIMFLLTLYIPFIILPWSIFRSLDVRIKGPFHEMRLYNGVVSTIKKIAMPVIPILIYIIFAANRLGIDALLGYITISLIFNLITMASTSVVYFVLYEKELIEDIVSRWRVFRPAPRLVELTKKEEQKRQVPATPQRYYDIDALPDFTSD